MDEVRDERSADREGQTQRHTHRERDRERQTERDIERERKTEKSDANDASFIYLFEIVLAGNASALPNAIQTPKNFIKSQKS